MNQTEHAQKFAQCCTNLRLLAEQLAHIDPDFTHADVARSHLAVGIDMLLSADGLDGAVRQLRQMADVMERGGWKPHTAH